MSTLIREVLADPDLAHDEVFRRLLQAGLQDLVNAEAAAVIGALTARRTGYLTVLAAVLVGDLILYAVGVPYMYLILHVYMQSAKTFSALLAAMLAGFGLDAALNLTKKEAWLLTGLTAAAICLSTLTTRQHVAVDVAGGILLAECAYWAAGHKEILEPFSRLADRLTGQCGPETGRRGRRA